MTTIDLGPAPAAPTEPWAGVPRRVGLTLSELTRACEIIGAPLPFEVNDRQEEGLDARLGRSRAAAEAEALTRAVAGFGDGATSLQRRDLLDSDGTLEAGIAGALGLLATPEVVIDLDVVVDDRRGRAWHRQKGEAAASLATVDGLVFELSWYPSAAWTTELGRTATLPGDTARMTSSVPEQLEVPFAVADAVFEALRTGRGDLVPVLTEGDIVTATALEAMATETHGRLRAIVASTTDAEDALIGTVSWSLVNDGWRSMRTVSLDGDLTLLITSVEPSELAADIARVLAEVAR
ncbi:hypothetical protein FB381_4690 [Nocardioides albertanoniae]|uniref:ESAT-6 protein secretion system EspG family protein n=1 Tax=Nocardioides albertanoniae TaxID=1175486 RepID=A0A543ADU0_9ACTN|nr:hypothetical protein [Nocardioides albertanoniae]TQL70748.1 hypothetical protein FB381_4690 [Nocardioides albertanoniae]